MVRIAWHCESVNCVALTALFELTFLNIQIITARKWQFQGEKGWDYRGILMTPRDASTEGLSVNCFPMK